MNTNREENKKENNMSNKSKKRSTGPNINLLGEQKRRAGRLDMKIAGVKTSSSFIWTLVVKKENIPPIGPLRPYRVLKGPKAPERTL